MNDKISVIIPVYNTARYLGQCLDSVIKQDHKNLEIILVNDASTDESLQICVKYAEKDSRIKIIDKPFNQGLELARRSGIEEATGKYIFHIDSDDWLAHSRVLSKMYRKAEETDADYVEIRAYRTIDRHGWFKKKINKNRIYGLLEQPELYDKYFLSFFGPRLLSVSIWGKLYRKAFLDQLDLPPLGVKMGEDLAYNIRLFPYLKKIFILPEFGYHYCYGGMTSTFNPRLLPDLKKLHEFKIEFLERAGYDKGRFTERCDFKNILKADIIQRIRFQHKKEKIISFLKKELTDKVYESLLDVDKELSFWDDPFVSALSQKDYEGMYEICVKLERQSSLRQKLVNVIARLVD